MPVQTGQHLDPCAGTLHQGGPDEDGLHAVSSTGTKGAHLQKGCEALLLAAEGIAAHRDIQDAQAGLEGKIGQIGGQKYHAGTGCQHGHAATAKVTQGDKEALLLQKRTHDRALASGQHQALDSHQIPASADFAHLCATLRKSPLMFGKSPLQG